MFCITVVTIICSPVICGQENKSSAWSCAPAKTTQSRWIYAAKAKATPKNSKMNSRGNMGCANQKTCVPMMDVRQQYLFYLIFYIFVVTAWDEKSWNFGNIFMLTKTPGSLIYYLFCNFWWTCCQNRGKERGGVRGWDEGRDCIVVDRAGHSKLMTSQAEFYLLSKQSKASKRGKGSFCSLPLKDFFGFCFQSLMSHFLGGLTYVFKLCFMILYEKLFNA